jgi:hypothetical protein
MGAESVAGHPAFIFPMGEGARTEMNCFRTFVFQNFSPINDVLTRAATGEQADEFGVLV